MITKENIFLRSFQSAAKIFLTKTRMRRFYHFYRSLLKKLDIFLDFCQSSSKQSIFMQPLGFRIKRLLLVFGDYAIFNFALLLTLLLRYGSISRDTLEQHAWPFLILTMIWIMSFYITGLYDLAITKESFKFLRTFLEGMIANLAIAFGYFYLIPIFGIAPRTNLILHFVLSLFLDYIWRLLFNKTVAQSLFRNRVLFIGHANDASHINELLKNSAVGFELIAVAETAPGARILDATVSWHANVGMIDQIIKEQNVHTLVLGHRPDEIPGLRDALYKTLFLPVTLLDRATLEEMTTGRVPVEHVSQTWFLENLRENEKTFYDSFKRLYDLLLAIPVSLTTVFIFPFVALAIKLTSPGPIFYSQIRVGKIGKTFRIWKFRTMHQDAEKSGQPLWAQVNDPRVTKIGSFLRTTRIDELPQIWNVIRGDMSFIGPRPERPEFVEELTKQMPYYSLRYLTRPGLTGWAQVKFPYAGTIKDNLKKLQYDLYYIRHRSLLLDLAITLKTIGVMLRKLGT